MKIRAFYIRFQIYSVTRAAVGAFIALAVLLAAARLPLSAQSTTADSVPIARPVEPQMQAPADAAAVFSELAPQAATAAPLPIPDVSGNYVLKPSDLISIRVYQEGDLNTNARLAQDGTIVLPLVGEVKVSDLTVRQAAQRIEDSYRDGYLVNPQVIITVSDFTEQFFTLLGQVNKPGTYALPAEGQLPLLRAIAMAGGYTRLAAPNKITIKRKIDGEEKIVKVDARKMSSKPDSEQQYIREGDIVTVGERWF